MMAYEDLPDSEFIPIFQDERKGADLLSDEEDWESETEIEDFQSMKSVRNLPILVSDHLIERYAQSVISDFTV